MMKTRRKIRKDASWNANIVLNWLGNVMISLLLKSMHSQITVIFFEAWVDLFHGLSGMTNYFHMIESGHMTNFLREWRTFYQYSQHGWEALNLLIKSIYYRWSQWGMHKGGLWR
jgi:hypothetical protein